MARRPGQQHKGWANIYMDTAHPEHTLALVDKKHRCSIIKHDEDSFDRRDGNVDRIVRVAFLR